MTVFLASLKSLGGELVVVCKITWCLLVAVGNQLNQHRMFYIRLRNAVTPGQVKVSRYNTNLVRH